MQASRMVTVLAAAGFVALACEDDNGGTGIPSDVEIFRATLNGANEVPALPSPTTATGEATMTALGNLVSWRVEAANINNVVDGHIHFGAAGAPGGVMVFLDPVPGDYTTSMVIAQGSFEVDDTVLVHMRAGNAYVNIHTNDGVDPANTGPGDFPGGEIRGQLSKQ